MLDKFKKQVKDLTSEYEKAKDLYDRAGLDAELKESALHSMANILQLQQLALANYGSAVQIENALTAAVSCEGCK